MRVFLDANILFSAAADDSPTRALLGIILRHAKAATNEHAWEEARRNVDQPRGHEAEARSEGKLLCHP